MKGMIIGGALCLIFALLFFVRIGGETPIDHLTALFESAPKTAPAKTAKAPTASPSVPTKVGAATTNAAKAPPLEKLTDGDQKNLDELIKKKTKAR